MSLSIVLCVCKNFAVSVFGHVFQIGRDEKRGKIEI